MLWVDARIGWAYVARGAPRGNEGGFARSRWNASSGLLSCFRIAAAFSRSAENVSVFRVRWLVCHRDAGVTLLIARYERPLIVARRCAAVGSLRLVVQIGVVGDYDATKPTHLATDAAIAHASEQLGSACDTTWVATDEISTYGVEVLKSFDGLIVAPGSPYRSCDGALAAIEQARVHDIPLLGTYGGFQHVVLEFARNVAGFEDAEHAEYDPYASKLFIAPLACSVAGQAMTVQLGAGSRAGRAYGRATALEHYYCNFGLNLEFLDVLVNGGLQVTGIDQDGEPRIVELADGRFFVATLFVPQTSSAPHSPHPLVVAFVAAAGAH